MNSNSSYTIWQPLLLSLMVAGGIIIGYKMNDRDELPIATHSTVQSTVGSGRVEQVLRYIEAKYVDDVDSKRLVDDAIYAIMATLDPHSMYIPSDDMVQVDEEMNGAYRGIGIEGRMIADTLHIVMATPDGPASEAGIRMFDKLLRINDTIVAGVGLTFDDIRDMLRAEVGTELTIDYLDNSSQRVETTKVVVADLPYSSVSAAHRIDSLVAYVKIDRFSSKTYEEFMISIEALIKEQEARHLIIDLRDNPGGLLPEATDILSQLFMQKGNLLVYTQDKNGRKNKYKSTGKPFFAIDKIAVLINENSASGSEIMAGAIQDWDRGVIVGRRSFGKGLVQDQYRLTDQSAIRLTTARYYTPSGRCIQKSYDDLQSYGDDLYDRYDAGELFAEDSIAIEDSLRYETMYLKRSIYGGGGITPDIFIPLDSMVVRADYDDVLRRTTLYAYHILPSIIGSLPATADQYMADFDLPPDWILSYHKHLNVEGEDLPIDLLQKYRPAIEIALLREVGRLRYGNEAVDPMLLSDDAYIKEALRYLLTDLAISDL